jgi:uncharacterized membrane protein
MNKIFGILLWFVVGLTLPALSQVSFTTDTKNPVREGERFRLVFRVNAEGKGFEAPDFDGFRVLSGPNRSSRSSVQIINGKVSRSVNYEYYFTLQALSKGTYTIGPASIRVDGKEYTTKPVEISVLPGNPPVNQQHSPNSGSTSVTSTPEDKSIAFLRAEASKNDPYLGEQVIVTYKLYYRVNISDYGITQTPSYPGCWSQDLSEKGGQSQQYTEVVNGQRYHVAEIYREAVFPQRSGEIVTNPMKFDIVARIQDRSSPGNDPFESFFDDPFFGGRTVKKTLTSNVLKFHVKPLPTEGQTTDFSGAVGNFSFGTELDKTRVKTNEAVNLTLKISGRGNIKLVDSPKIQFPPDFEVYDPEVHTRINTSLQSGVSGIKTFKYLMIPRVEGTFTIDPVRFTYYDLDRKQYIATQTKPMTIEVLKGDGSQSTVALRPASQAKIQYLGNDIRFIKTSPLNLRPIGDVFFNSKLFYGLLSGMVLLVLIMVLMMSLTRKKKNNVVLQKERKATKVARKRLKSAKWHLDKKEEEQFYTALNQALWGYIADKFSLRPGDLSMDNVRRKLQEKQVDAAIIDEFVATLEKCEFGRYAPGDKTRMIADTYQSATDIIVKTEKELR